MSRCYQCPRGCGADREITVGYCGVKGLRAARASLHYGEEPCISGKNGSGAIFFSGCVLKCVFCQNYPISQEGRGKDITADDLERVIFELRDKGAHNINLVTPTQFSYAIAEVLEKVKPRLDIPVIWNCGGYESVETLRRLEGLVDIFLPDLKYADGARAEKYSFARDYPQKALAAIKTMYELTGAAGFDGGMMTKGVMVRHLVLPDGRRDSVKALEMLAETVPTDKIRLSIMRQYLPCHKAAQYPEIDRKVTTFEYEKVVDRAAELGFIGYTQEKESAGAEFIPLWDLTGL